MKLQYTYASWERMAEYELDDAIKAQSLVENPHIFRTQKEADFFSGYCLVMGVAIEVHVKWKMPRHLKKSGLVLWAKIPNLNRESPQ